MISKLQILLLAFTVAVMTSCASLSGFQDGRAIGAENFEIMGSINATKTPEFDLIEGLDTFGVEDQSIPTFYFPSLEVGFKYGVTDRLDVSARLNTSLNIGLGAKYQLLGTPNDKYALGAGLELGSFGVVTGLWNVQIPLYASIHPSDIFTFYASPKYIHQFDSFGLGASLGYLGGNAGILIGRNNKFGVDVGYYQLSGLGFLNTNLLHFGVGGKFLISGDRDREGAPDRNMPSKKKKKRRK